MEWTQLTPTKAWSGDHVGADEWKIRVFALLSGDNDDDELVHRVATWWSRAVDGLPKSGGSDYLNYHVIRELEQAEAPTVDDRFWCHDASGGDEGVWRVRTGAEFYGQGWQGSVWVQLFYRFHAYVMK